MMVRCRRRRQEVQAEGEGTWIACLSSKLKSVCCSALHLLTRPEAHLPATNHTRRPDSHKMRPLTMLPACSCVTALSLHFLISFDRQSNCENEYAGCMQGSCWRRVLF